MIFMDNYVIVLYMHKSDLKGLESVLYIGDAKTLG